MLETFQLVKAPVVMCGRENEEYKPQRLLYERVL